MESMTSRRVKINIGEQYGLWTVKAEAGSNRHGKRQWLCVCQCGKEGVVVGSALVNGHSSSCFQCSRLRTAAANTVHGHSRRTATTPEYMTWRAMLQRCEDLNASKFSAYGGVGITVCERWHSFAEFLEDMGLKPSPKHTIDRIDGSGNYEPSNCRWATNTQQSRNRRNNRLLTYRGRTQCLQAWCDELGISRSALKNRIRRGWSVEKALVTPVA